MIPNDPHAPWWATEAEHPDPGVTQYLRPVGRVMCGDSREELSVYLIQRDSDPAQISVAGVLLSAIEADLYCRLVRSAMLLMAAGVLDQPSR